MVRYRNITTTENLEMNIYELLEEVYDRCNTILEAPSVDREPGVTSLALLLRKHVDLILYIYERSINTLTREIMCKKYHIDFECESFKQLCNRCHVALCIGVIDYDADQATRALLDQVKDLLDLLHDPYVY